MTLASFEGHPTTQSNASHLLDCPSTRTFGVLATDNEHDSEDHSAPCADEFRAASVAIHSYLANPNTIPLSIPCNIGLYHRLLDEGVLLIDETAASFSYDSYRSVLRIRSYTMRIHDVPLTFISCIVFSNPTLSPLSRKIKITGATTDFSGFSGRYKDSRKQPDVAIWTKVDYWPTVVVEAGWNEDYLNLIADTRMWLLGGRDGDQSHAGQVNVVILVNFTETTSMDVDSRLGPSSGYQGDRKEKNVDCLDDSDANMQELGARLEVWRRCNGAEDVELVQSHDFYPTNRDGGDDRMHLTVGDIIPSEYYLAQRISPSKKILFDLDILREHIDDSIQFLSIDRETTSRIKAQKRKELLCKHTSF
ncbi:hypothetical protein BJ138DRAFT_794304 [Hygrophoropsis aurantiaca]|uniref:Uncharacterized protein n=1 Tax=Hygrophoropsis aurantiaca TaxID=72124 RepID=A0ACB8AFS2_9AGAM|nr:hypothetical protein BJ138DRAFT_794304 [Hygrophoropsis aurantiaca]